MEVIQTLLRTFRGLKKVVWQSIKGFLLELSVELFHQSALAENVSRNLNGLLVEPVMVLWLSPTE